MVGLNGSGGDSKTHQQVVHVGSGAADQALAWAGERPEVQSDVIGSINGAGGPQDGV